MDISLRLRMQMMERQLANLTGLVHKALTTGRQSSLTRDVEVNLNKEHVQIPASSTPTPPVTRDTGTPYRSTVEKPTKSAIKPSSRQTSLTEVQLTPEMYNQLRLLKKKTKDLRLEVRNLRRMSQAQALNIKETIRETFLKIKAMLAAVQVNDQVQSERVRVSREEELYTQDVQRLEKDLSELESAVEELRSNVINRRCRVNMSDVESMALVLSKSSKTVADLKARFPNLQESLKAVMAAEMEVVVHEEKFLKEEPERLETALRRCKKLTGTLVTLKRLASVQEQRLPPSGSGPLSPSLTGEQREHALPHGGSLDAQLSKSSRRDWKWSTNFREHIDHWRGFSTSGWSEKAASFSGELRSSYDGQKPQKAENALDALLDELQTFAKPLDRKTEVVLGGSLKRVSSYSGTDSPVKGQLVSQSSTGTGSTSLNATTTTAVSKLQVAEAGSKHNVSLSPTPSPIPTEGKISPVSQELLNKMSTTSLKHNEGVDLSNVTKSISPVPGVTKKVPPPPPPRTSSKSPLMSPTSPMSPTNRLLAVGTLPRGSSLQGTVLARVSSFEPSLSQYRSNTELVTDDSDVFSSRSLSKNVSKKDPSLVIRTSAISDENLRREQLSSNSSSSESVNSQEGVQMRLGHHLDRGNSPGNIHHISSGAMSDSETIKKPTPPLPPSRNRQELLEQRHQELLRKQRQLQEQYARLQQLQRGQTLQRFSPPRSPADLKKTGSESNILLKAGLTMSPASGSLTHLAPLGKSITTSNSFIGSTNVTAPVTPPSATTTATTVSSNQVTSKIYETDIL